MFPLPVFELVFVNGHKISPRRNEPCESLCNKIDLIKTTKAALALATWASVHKNCPDNPSRGCITRETPSLKQELEPRNESSVIFFYYQGIPWVSFKADLCSSPSSFKTEPP